MKRVIAIGLTTLACMGIGFSQSHTFNDITVGSWYEKATIRLSNQSIIKGYPDGTFRPYEALNGDQFIAMVLRSVLSEDIKNSEEYWAESIINRAIELDLIEAGDYQQAISREDMSDIIVKALALSGETLPEDVSRVQTIVKDNKLFSEDKARAAYQCYEMGIITGYPDYTFGPKNTLTRSEASAVILRLIDKNERQPFDYEKLNERANDAVASKMPGGDEWIDSRLLSIEENAIIDHSLMPPLVKAVDDYIRSTGNPWTLLDHNKRSFNGEIIYIFPRDFVYEGDKDPDLNEELRMQYVKEQRLLFARLLRRRGVDEKTIDEAIAYLEQKNSASYKRGLSIEEEWKLFPTFTDEKSVDDWKSMSLPERIWETDQYRLIIDGQRMSGNDPFSTGYLFNEREAKE